MSKSYKNNNVSKILIFSVLVNAAILIVYITVVFGMKTNIFVINKDTLDKKMVAYLETLSNRLDYYNGKMNGIVENYPFVDFIDESLLVGVNDDRVDKIVELFRGVERPFSSVSLYTKDGQTVFSRPIRMKSSNATNSNIMNNIKIVDSSVVFTLYGDVYDGIEFTSSLKNTTDAVVGYITASVDKAIFSDIVDSSHILLLPNGVIYYDSDSDTDIAKLSKERLISLLNNASEDDSYFVKIGDANLLFYASVLDRVLGLNIGFLVKDATLLQQYFKYIILAVLIFSLLFLTSILISESVKKRELVLDSNSLIALDGGIAISPIKDDEGIEEYNSNDTQSKKVGDIDSKAVFDSVDNDDLEVEESILTKEDILKKEDSYFTSKNAFTIPLNNDFLTKESKEYSDEFSNLLDENIHLENKKLEESQIINTSNTAEIEEVPKIPDDYYKTEENSIEKGSEDKSNIEYDDSEKKIVEVSWNSLLRSVKNKKFVDKEMSYMLDWVMDNSGVNPYNSVMLRYNSDDKKYTVGEFNNVSDKTKSILEISEDEIIFSKLLSTGKPLYVQNPSQSKTLSKKFDTEDIKDVSKMLFIPIENLKGDIKAFFILSSKDL